MTLISARHRLRGGRVHTIVHAGGRLYELLTRAGQDLHSRPLGFSVWVREHNQFHPDEEAALRAGLRAIERLSAGPPPPVAYRQLVLPVPYEHLWFLAA